MEVWHVTVKLLNNLGWIMLWLGCTEEQINEWTDYGCNNDPVKKVENTFFMTMTTLLIWTYWKTVVNIWLERAFTDLDYSRSSSLSTKWSLWQMATCIGPSHFESVEGALARLCLKYTFFWAVATWAVGSSTFTSSVGLLLGICHLNWYWSI